MKAYAIFDGGGVLGAALAGALKAAEKKRVEFVGFGGTSAGSIVATLAAAGYSGDEVEEILVDTEFTTLLGGNGLPVEAFKAQVGALVAGLDHGLLGKLGVGLRAFMACVGVGPLKQTLMTKFGVDDGQALKVFLLEKILEKQPGLAGASDITFTDFAKLEDTPDESHRCYPLKIVASDVSRRRPVVFSTDETGYGNSVLDAVRASTCYPFVFQPVDRNRQCWLVDGGLASSLPAFLFHEEQERTRYPVFAFDLTSEPSVVSSADYDLKRYLKDMISTALDAGDELLRKVLKDVIHVPIRIPDEFDVLDFRISREGRQRLFELGYQQTMQFLDDLEILQLHNQAVDFVEQLKKNGLDDTEVRERVIQRQLQVRYGDRKLFEAVLFGLARDIETYTHAENVRASIMLRTEKLNDAGQPTRIVVYSYGMRDDQDRPHGDATLEIAEDAGCSGQAWSARRPTCADLVRAFRNPALWKMSRGQHSRVPRDRKSMLSVPIWNHPEAEKDPNSVPVGTLSIDSSTPLDDTYWLGDDRAGTSGYGASLRSDVIERMLVWENVIRKLFI